MSNDSIPFFERADRVTGKASAAITGKTFVKVSGNKDTTTGAYSFAPAGAGEVPFGVAAFDTPSGGLVTVYALSSGLIVPVTASGALAANDPVKVAAGGLAIKASAGDPAYGRAMTSAADTTDAEIVIGFTFTPSA